MLYTTVSPLCKVVQYRSVVSYKPPTYGVFSTQKKGSSSAVQASGHSRQRKARRSGLWLEGHHYDQKEVEDGCADDETKGNLCIVRHYILQCKKNPEPVTLRGLVSSS
jgi:hypothetical protein